MPGPNLCHPLFQSHPVRQGGVDVHEVEPPRQDGHYGDYDHEDGGEPEVRFGHGVGERAHVGPVAYVVVEVVGHEVKGQGAPDHDVIEDCPVQCVQCDLKLNK